MPANDNIEVRSVYGQATGIALVAIERNGEQIAQFSAIEARRIAALINECADAAEGDRFIVEFMREGVGLSLEKAVAVLVEFRKRRDAWRIQEVGRIRHKQ